MPNLSEKTGLIKYEFTAKPYKYQAEGASCGWIFIAFPKELAIAIREHHKWQEEGWGRMKATAWIGGSEWKTSIWFDTKLETYLLPLKAEIRKKEKIETGKDVKTVIWV